VRHGGIGREPAHGDRRRLVDGVERGRARGDLDGGGADQRLCPDLVSGSEQEHLPVAAFTTWLWGLVATGGFLWAMARLRGSASRRPIWIGLAVATLTAWLVATILSLALPVVETGSDPTRIPIAAIVSPVAAAALTVLAGIIAGVFSRPPEAS
jgi:hypothetical protein